jgi:hypothetical protein
MPSAPAPSQCRQALGDLLLAYERLLRETRRLVRRSDRAELEMNQLNSRLQDLAAELEHRATHDTLTGVLNRAAVIELVNQYFVHDDLSLIVLDIDHFKRINDSFGHPTGQGHPRRCCLSSGCGAFLSRSAGSAVKSSRLCYLVRVRTFRKTCTGSPACD